MPGVHSTPGNLQLQVGNAIPDASDGAIVAQNLHDGVQVGAVGLSGDCLPQEGGNVGHGAGIGAGVGLIGLHVRGEAHFGGDGLDLLEPGGGVVGGVVNGGKFFQHGGNDSHAEPLREHRLGQVFVIEEIQAGVYREHHQETRQFVDVTLA